MRKLVPAFFLSVFMSYCGSQPKKEKTINSSGVHAMESPVDSVSAEPYLFADKNGLVYLSWITQEGQSSKMQYSTLNNDKWSQPSVIATGNDWFVNWADYPTIAANGNNIIAHFLQKSEQGTYTYDIRITTSTVNDSSWSVPAILHNDGKKAEHGFVSIIPYGTNYLISWLDGRNAAMEGGEDHQNGHHGQMTVRAAVVDISGNKLNEWELDSRVCDCCQTSAAITDSGPVIVYRDRSEQEIRDISIVRFLNGEWTAPKPIFSDNWKIEGCPVNGPRIASAGSAVAVAWFTSPDKSGQVKVAFSHDAGATFSTPINVNDAKTIGRVDIELLNEKTAMVSWMEGSEIKATKVHSDGRKDVPEVIASTTDSRSGGFPQMAKSGNRILFAWTDNKQKAVKVASLSY